MASLKETEVRRFGITLIKITVSAGLMAFILARLDFLELRSSVADVQMGLLGLAFSLHGVGLLLSTARWQILLNVQRIHFSFRETLFIYWIASFFNAFLPSSVGGDVVKGFIASKRDGRIIEAFSTVLVERLVGVLALGSIAAVAFIWLGVLPAVIWLGIITLLVAIILLLGRNGIRRGMQPWEEPEIREDKTHGWFWRTRKTIRRFGWYKRELCWTFLLSLLLQFNTIFCYFLIARALDINLSFLYFCLLIPPIVIFTMLPVSIGGIGVREVAFVLFFGSLGLTFEKAISLSLWSYFLTLLANLGGGVIYSFYKTPVSPVRAIDSLTN